MKKPSIYIIIFLLLIIILFISITIFSKLRNKHLIKATEVLLAGVDYNKRIKKAFEDREQQIIKIKETIIKVPDRKLAKELQKQIDDLIKTDNEIFKIKDDRIAALEKQLIKTNKALKRKNKVSITPIFALGTDQEFNLNFQIGLTVNGYVYNGFLIDVSIGGGASYSNRTDFQETIHGANILFDISINF
jgi:hypothetical protein